MNIMSVQAVTSQTKVDVKTTDGEGKGDFSAVLTAESDAAYVKRGSSSRAKDEGAAHEASNVSETVTESNAKEAHASEQDNTEHSATDENSVSLVVMAPANTQAAGGKALPSDSDSDADSDEYKSSTNRTAAPLFTGAEPSSDAAHQYDEVSSDDKKPDTKQMAKSTSTIEAKADPKTDSEHKIAAQQAGANTKRAQKDDAKLADTPKAEVVKPVDGNKRAIVLEQANLATEKASQAGGSKQALEPKPESSAAKEAKQQESSKGAMASEKESSVTEGSKQSDGNKRAIVLEQANLATEKASQADVKPVDTKTTGQHVSSLADEAAEGEEGALLMQARRASSTTKPSAAQVIAPNIEKAPDGIHHANGIDTDEEVESVESSRKPADKAALDKAVDTQVRTSTASQAPNWLAQIQHGERWANKADQTSSNASAIEESPFTEKNSLAQAVEGAVKNAQTEQNTRWSAVNSLVLSDADREAAAVSQSVSAHSDTQDASLMNLIRDSQQVLTNDRLPLEQRAINLQQGVEQSAKQLAQQAQVVVSQNLQEADIQLNPSQLGHLKIQVRMEQGEVQIQFVAQNPQARELLEQALPRLREMLTQQGMQLAQGQTGQQGQQPQQGGQQQSQQQMLNQQQSGLNAAMQQGADQGGGSQQDQQQATQHAGHYAGANGVAAESAETDADTYLELADSVRSPSRLRSDARIDFFA